MATLGPGFTICGEERHLETRVGASGGTLELLGVDSSPGKLPESRGREKSRAVPVVLLS